MKEVVKAADYQRVDSLFVAKGHQQWGRFDPHKNTVQMHEQKQAGDEELLDFAAIHSLGSGGIVIAVKPEQIPAKPTLIAIYRDSLFCT